MVATEIYFSDNINCTSSNQHREISKFPKQLTIKRSHNSSQYILEKIISAFNPYYCDTKYFVLFTIERLNYPSNNIDTHCHDRRIEKKR
jgi:hypothetical protein